MKKWCIINRWRAFLLAVALVLGLCAGAFFLFQKPYDRGQADERQARAGKGLSEYAVDAALHPEDGTLTVTETIRFENGTGEALSELFVRTYAGAYAAEETSPAATTELFEACYGDAFSPGDISLYGVWWNGAPVNARFTDKARTVLSVPAALSPGEKGELTLNFVLTIPACAHRFGVWEGVYRFGNVLPTLAPYENGAWRTDEYVSIGDPFVSECANWAFALTVPEGYEALASAPLKEENGRLTGTLAAARDFAFAVSDQWTLAAGAAKGVALTAAARTEKDARAALQWLTRAMDTLTDLYGDAPYAALSLCEAGMPFGAEYPGFMLVPSDGFKEESGLELLIVHGAAHQWFSALVGSDQFMNPWQDEALSEWAALRYALRRYGQESMEALRRYRVDEPMREHIGQTVTPGSPVSYFPDLTTYEAVVLGRGAALLVALDEMTGGKMDAFLKSYCGEFAFALASREDFERAMNAYAGLDLTPLFTDYLDTYMTN